MGTERLAAVTGASRGIGRGVAIALGELGCELALIARSEEDTERVAAAARERGAPGAVAIPADLADGKSCATVPERIAAECGRDPEIFVHCAGIARNGAVGELSLADWADSMQVNATAAFQLASAFGPRMAAAGWGRIVCIGSLYSRFGVARTAAYTASKHALLGLTRALAAEYASKGVTANAVIPGFVDTEMIREQVDEAASARGLGREQVVQRFLSGQPIGRMVEVEEVADLVAYLCSDGAAAITGQAIDIDGGAYQA